MSPTEVWATLLDEGRYLGSISTFYRLLRQAGESRERRSTGHPPGRRETGTGCLPTEFRMVMGYHQAARPREVELVLPVRDLGHLLRYVVGWIVVTRESAALAEVLIRQDVCQAGIGCDELTIHADRGSTMTSKRWRSCSPTSASPSANRARTCRRKPVQRGAIQDTEVSAQLLSTGSTRSRPLSDRQILLRLVQQRTSPYRAGLDVPADVHDGAAAITREKRAGVRSTPHTPPPSYGLWKAARATDPAQRFVDQQARRHRGGRSVNTADGASFRLTDSGRAADAWESLVAIADAAGGRLAGRRRAACPGIGLDAGRVHRRGPVERQSSCLATSEREFDDSGRAVPVVRGYGRCPVGDRGFPGADFELTQNGWPPAAAGLRDLEPTRVPNGFRARVSVDRPRGRFRPVSTRGESR